MATVDKTQPGDEWIFRAIDKDLNVMFIYGRPTLIGARRLAHEKLRAKLLVEDPIRKDQRRWRI